MDDLGFVDLEELRKHIKDANNYGKSGFCFRIGDKFVKIYARDEDNKYKIFVPPDTKKITDFSGLKADTIIFPNEYIHENGLKAGEISDYISDERFDLALKTGLKINPMTTSYDRVIADMYLYRDIYMLDLCFANILYSDQNGFHIIDTTDWYFERDSLKDNVYYFNLSIVKEIINYLEMPYKETYYGRDLRYYVYDDFLKKIKKYGDKGTKLVNNLSLLREDKYSFLEFIYAYNDVYRIHYGNDAKTLEDVKELTKILKKG